MSFSKIFPLLAASNITEQNREDIVDYEWYTNKNTIHVCICVYGKSWILTRRVRDDLGNVHQYFALNSTLLHHTQTDTHTYTYAHIYTCTYIYIHTHTAHQTGYIMWLELNIMSLVTVCAGTCVQCTCMLRVFVCTWIDVMWPHF